MPTLICFDMDGVIFEHKNFWMELHKALGTLEEGKRLTEKHLKESGDVLHGREGFEGDSAVSSLN